MVSKPPDPEVWYIKTSGSGGFRAMKSLLEVEKISENLHLKNFKRSYQKSVPPKMSTFESFISVENLMAPTLLVFEGKRITT